MSSPYTAEQNLAWHNKLPAKRCAASIVAWNNQGEILVVMSDKDEFWALPGGVVEEGESPQSGALRELHEETGLQMYPGQVRLLGVNYAAKYKDYLDFLHFYFSAGMLSKHQLQLLGEASEKTHGIKFLSRHELSSHVAPHRLRALDSLFESFNHDALYIETSLVE